MAIKLLFWIFLFIIFYTYIGYGILIWLLVKIKEIFISKEKKQVHSEQLEVTLLIAAYNEEAMADTKMANSLQLDYPKDKLRIVWVTDGSTDKTNDILKPYDGVTVLHSSQRRGKTAAVNRAMAYIESPIVIFTDANTMLNAESIKNIVELFDDPKVGCVSGEKRIAIQSKDGAASSGEGFYWRYESTLKSLDSRLYSVVGAAGELYAIRRSLYEDIPEDTLLDDFILSLNIARKGYRIAYCPEAYAIESGSADMHEEQKRKVRIAAGGLQSVWRLRSLLNIFRYRILSFQYISHRVLRWTITPIALLALLPLNIIACFQSVDSELVFYSVFLVLQCLFYLLGFTGYLLAKKEIKNKILFVPYYFLFMNLNVLKAYPYLLNNKKSGIWDKAKRKDV